MSNILTRHKKVNIYIIFLKNILKSSTCITAKNAQTEEEECVHVVEICNFHSRKNKISTEHQYITYTVLSIQIPLVNLKLIISQ